MNRNTALDEKLSQDFDHRLVRQASPNTHSQAFARELIHDIQDTELDAIMCPIFHEIITPDMFGELCTQTYDRAIIEP